MISSSFVDLLGSVWNTSFVYQLLSIPKVLLFAVIVIVAFLGFYFRYQKKLVWSDDNIWTVISNLSTFLIDCGRYPINVYCILSTIALKAGEWDFLEWEKGETGSWDHQLHLRWTQSERKPQKSWNHSFSVSIDLLSSHLNIPTRLPARMELRWEVHLLFLLWVNTLSQRVERCVTL